MCHCVRWRLLFGTSFPQSSPLNFMPIGRFMFRICTADYHERCVFKACLCQSLVRRVSVRCQIIVAIHNEGNDAVVHRYAALKALHSMIKDILDIRRFADADTPAPGRCAREDTALIHHSSFTRHQSFHGKTVAV